MRSITCLIHFDFIGISTLGAAAINDVAAWLLLALCIAVAAAGNPLNIVYIFLMLFGFLIFMVFFVRYLMEKGMKYLVHDDASIHTNGVLVMSMTCLAASWVHHQITPIILI